jgi:hypothetical protein
LISALERDNRSASQPTRFTPEERALKEPEKGSPKYPLHKRLAVARILSRYCVELVGHLTPVPEPSELIYGRKEL